MQLTSPAFKNNTTIPKKFTCQGEDISPPLEIHNAPPETKSFVLIMDDPDAPGSTWDHWVVWNIPPSTTNIPENSKPGEEGVNSWTKKGYGGPCPPSGTHRYIFTLYALNTTLQLQNTATKHVVKEAMKDNVLAQTELIGLYEKT